MKKVIIATLAFAFVATLSSCKKDFECCQKENVVGATPMCTPQKLTRKAARDLEDANTLKDEEGMFVTVMTCIEQ